MKKRIDVDELTPVVGTLYPSPFDIPCRARARTKLGDAAGLCGEAAYARAEELAGRAPAGSRGVVSFAGGAAEESEPITPLGSPETARAI